MALPKTPAPEPEAKDRSLVVQDELTMAQQVWRRFKRSRLAMISLVVLAILYLIAIFAPYLASQPMDYLEVSARYLSPSWAHPMGTDNLGRDILSRMIWASRISLTVGFVAMGISVVVGTLVGAVAGYYGGSWIDIVLMRIAEAIDVIPVFFLLVTIVSVIRPSIFNIMMVIGLTSWPALAHVVRSQFLSLRQRDYTEASRAMGATDMRLIFRHILPNAAAPIIVSATLRVGGAILTESALSFLGLGTQPPQISWGQMLTLGRASLRYAPWASIFPGLAIFIVVMSFNFVGDGLRDALDPKMKR